MFTKRVVAPLALLAFTLPACRAGGQEPAAPPAPSQQPRPTTPQMPHLPARGLTEPDEPAHPDPPDERTFTDAKYKVSFTVPPGWNLERRDGVLSNFGVESRTARRGTDVRGVAAINFNPWPISTFAGATFYFAVLPRSTPEQCAAQASAKPVKALPAASIDGRPFHHGHDQHGAVCTEARDEVFTAMQGRSCLRFDLVVNTFCAETSGAQEITPAQLEDVDRRLAGILGSVHLGAGTHGDGPDRSR